MENDIQKLIDHLERLRVHMIGLGHPIIASGLIPVINNLRKKQEQQGKENSK